MAALLFSTDLLVTAAVAVAAVLALSGIALAHGQEASALLNGAGALALIRFATTRAPLFASARAAAAIRDAVERLMRALARRPIAALAATTLLATAWKLALIAQAPGFYSGDDLEPLELAAAMQSGRSAVESGAWVIRGPLYPAIGILPFAVLFEAVGIAAPDSYLLAARASGLVFSTANVALLFLLARRVFGDRGLAALAAGTFALSGLGIAFATGAFPRVLITTFVLLGARAFVAERLRWIGALAAGACFGVAFCLRYSEIWLLVPVAAVSLRREGLAAAIRRTALVTLGFGLALALVAGVGDALYWGEPFFSLRQMIDYTLVRGESTRGFQSVVFYLTEFRTFWSVPALALIVLAGARDETPLRAHYWVWLAVFCLSLLPHKETRYLLPVLPFFWLAAVQGARALARRGATLAWVAAAMVVAVLAQTDGRLHVLRDGRHDAFRAARWLAPRLGGAPMLVDHGWAYGGRLLLPSSRIVEERLPAEFAATEVRWVLLDTRASAAALAQARAAGFTEARRFGAVVALTK